jgi:hypothetical protein
MSRCDLCFGDGWIGDSLDEFRLCAPDEQIIFLSRMDYGSRIACPRCRPSWATTAAVIKDYAPKPERVPLIPWYVVAVAAVLFLHALDYALGRL